MNYMTYHEEYESMPRERYEELKCLMEAAEPKKRFETYTLRKLAFQGADDLHGVPRFFLCVKNMDEQQIWLEKKFSQNGVTFKKCEKLTRAECGRILSGDVEWMKNHKKSLFTDFYRQVTLNHLSPWRVTDYKRQSMKCKKEGCVTFQTEIRRAVGRVRDLFAEPEFTISCLDEGKVLAAYKKDVRLPAMVAAVFQSQDEPEAEPVC